jgi:hypothetical protein
MLEKLKTILARTYLTTTGVLFFFSAFASMEKNRRV